jgi:hypothetical protein
VPHIRMMRMSQLSPLPPSASHALRKGKGATRTVAAARPCADPLRAAHGDADACSTITLACCSCSPFFPLCPSALSAPLLSAALPTAGWGARPRDAPRRKAKRTQRAQEQRNWEENKRNEKRPSHTTHGCHFHARLFFVCGAPCRPSVPKVFGRRSALGLASNR